uniref:Uncharacterized protein n=1 Tax=Rousettus aegyptiacus TaxID=9407 RepID=A0A7J8DID1_ROUAE|nr:hypothetical protein HJG63_008504 [Rousettus aegyptiacus]
MLRLPNNHKLTLIKRETGLFENVVMREFPPTGKLGSGGGGAPAFLLASSHPEEGRNEQYPARGRGLRGHTLPAGLVLPRPTRAPCARGLWGLPLDARFGEDAQGARKGGSSPRFLRITRIQYCLEPGGLGNSESLQVPDTASTSERFSCSEH